MRKPDNDQMRNYLAGTALIVATLAMIAPGLTFGCQYIDNTVTDVSISDFYIQKSSRPTSQGQAENPSPGIRVSGRVNVLVSNPGNRPISLDRIYVRLYGHDYKALVELKSVPSCAPAIGSEILVDSKGERLNFDARVINAQQVLSIPVAFMVFSTTDSSESRKQGILCISIQGSNYKGTSAVLEFPIGFINVTNSTVSQPEGDVSFRPPYKIKTGELHPLFR